MLFDRKITISCGSSRKATVWKAQTLMLSELWEKLKIPARSTETLADYMNMKKAQQDDLKDVGGYVGGTLNGTRRKANNVIGRDIVPSTLTVFRQDIKMIFCGELKLSAADTAFTAQESISLPHRDCV